MDFEIPPSIQSTLDALVELHTERSEEVQMRKVGQQLFGIGQS